MLFRETFALYCDNHTEHTDTLCGQNSEFYYVKAGGMYNNHRALNGYAVRRNSLPVIETPEGILLMLKSG
jgi:hypothetical protein